MDVGELQKRMEVTFNVDGIFGGRLLPILNAEKAYGAHIATTYRGHLVLINSFFDFFIETIQQAVAWTQTNGWPKERRDISTGSCVAKTTVELELIQ